MGMEAWKVRGEGDEAMRLSDGADSGLLGGGEYPGVVQHARFKRNVFAFVLVARLNRELHRLGHGCSKSDLLFRLGPLHAGKQRGELAFSDQRAGVEGVVVRAQSVVRGAEVVGMLRRCLLFERFYRVHRSVVSALANGVVLLATSDA